MNVPRYNERFWSEASHFPPEEWARLVKSVEKGREEAPGDDGAARGGSGVCPDCSRKRQGLN